MVSHDLVFSVLITGAVGLQQKPSILGIMFILHGDGRVAVFHARDQNLTPVTDFYLSFALSLAVTTSISKP